MSNTDVAVENVRLQNRAECERASIDDCASWCEGEEGWGVGGDDD